MASRSLRLLWFGATALILPISTPFLALDLCSPHSQICTNLIANLAQLSMAFIHTHTSLAHDDGPNVSDSTRRYPPLPVLASWRCPREVFCYILTRDRRDDYGLFSSRGPVLPVSPSAPRPASKSHSCMLHPGNLNPSHPARRAEIPSRPLSLRFSAFYPLGPLMRQGS